MDFDVVVLIGVGWVFLVGGDLEYIEGNVVNLENFEYEVCLVK